MNDLKFALFWILCVAMLPVNAEPSIQIDTPRGGWRLASGEGADFTQAINYPAVSVSTPANQADTARIRGRIQSLTKTGAPAKLVVNGVSMPLKLHENGVFDRPYSFPAGSNSLEVRHPDGKGRQRVQFYSNGKGGTPARLRVVLSWDSDNTDLDLHVITPDGEHAWYGSQVLKNGAALDVDVTTGYGPEIFATPTPLTGQYLVYVNYYGGGYYSNQDGESEAAQALTTARISIISQEGTLNEKQESFLVPMRATGELTLVKRFAYP